MAWFIKIGVVLLFFVIAFYHLYFFITPSVTIQNLSKDIITTVNVSLPKSYLNFGAIKPKQKNTIYYSLSQNDGSYHYSFDIDSHSMKGACGNLTDSEFNKRFVITIDKSYQVVCSQ